MSLLERRRYADITGKSYSIGNRSGENGAKTPEAMQARQAAIQAMEVKEQVEREKRRDEEKKAGWSPRRKEGEESRNVQSGVPHGLDSPVKKMGWDLRKWRRGIRRGGKPEQKPHYKTDDERRKLAA